MTDVEIPCDRCGNPAESGPLEGRMTLCDGCIADVVGHHSGVTTHWIKRPRLLPATAEVRRTRSGAVRQAREAAKAKSEADGEKKVPTP